MTPKRLKKRSKAAQAVGTKLYQQEQSKQSADNSNQSEPKKEDGPIEGEVVDDKK